MSIEGDKESKVRAPVEKPDPRVWRPRRDPPRVRKRAAYVGPDASGSVGLGPSRWGRGPWGVAPTRERRTAGAEVRERGLGNSLSLPAPRSRSQAPLAASTPAPGTPSPDPVLSLSVPLPGLAPTFGVRRVERTGSPALRPGRRLPSPATGRAAAGPGRPQKGARRAVPPSSTAPLLLAVATLVQGRGDGPETPRVRPAGVAPLRCGRGGRVGVSEQDRGSFLSRRDRCPSLRPRPASAGDRKHPSRGSEVQRVERAMASFRGGPRDLTPLVRYGEGGFSRPQRCDFGTRFVWGDGWER